MVSNKTEIMIIVFIYRYILWIFYILGNVGHLLNIYILTRSCFRSNPCSLYFLALTLANLIIVWVFIPLRILQYGFNIDPKSSSLLFCKLYFFFNDSIRILSSWFLTLACADRYCFTSSNIGLRQLSTIINTRFVISLFSIFIFFLNIHIIMFYKIDNIINQCIPLVGIYQKFINIYRLIMNLICPFLLMCIFGILILNNIFQSKKRISPFMIAIVYNHHTIRKKRQIDNQIYFMLFIQCFSFILMNILLFINEFFLFISLINHSITFYFFIVSSHLFRREVIKFGKKIIRGRIEVN